MKTITSTRIPANCLNMLSLNHANCRVNLLWINIFPFFRVLHLIHSVEQLKICFWPWTRNVHDCHRFLKTQGVFKLMFPFLLVWQSPEFNEKFCSEHALYESFCVFAFWRTEVWHSVRFTNICFSLESWPKNIETLKN